MTCPEPGRVAPLSAPNGIVFTAPTMEAGGIMRSGRGLSMTPWAQVKIQGKQPSFGPNKEENSNDGAYACLPPGVPVCTPP